MGKMCWIIPELRNVFSPDIKIASLHGKMKAKEKNVIMEAFAAGEIQILVSTTVVEVGVMCLMLQL